MPRLAQPSRFARTAFPILFAAALLASSCSRQAPLSPSAAAEDAVPEVDVTVLKRIESGARMPASASDDDRGRHVVFLPAGSTDALANAIAEVGPHGIVVLRAGVHHESGPVEIGIPVSILGEPGAVLESAVPTWPVASPTIQAALWVRSPGFTLRGVEMRPAGGLGGTALLLQGSAGAAVFQNNIHDFQFGVLVQQSDRVRIFDNRVAVTPAWLSDPTVPEADGIININGVGAIIARNQVSNGTFGIFCCDRGGLAFANRTTNNAVGLILCRVPYEALTLPDGVAVGAETSATGWLAQANVSFGNFTTGILIIDGANQNRVISNDSHDNGGYAVEFTTDTFRFGFLTPAAFNNVFVAGAFPDIQVKDCGVGNRIVGGHLVDNSVEPCN